MTEGTKLLKWLMDNKVIETRFDKTLNEQMVQITDFGVEISMILDQLKTNSEAARATNEFAAEVTENDNNAN